MKYFEIDNKELSGIQVCFYNGTTSHPNTIRNLYERTSLKSVPYGFDLEEVNKTIKKHVGLINFKETT